MERAKFRWLRFASFLALGVSTVSVTVAGERHRAWIDPPSDLLAEATPDTGPDPSANERSAEPRSAKAISADTGEETRSVSPSEQPSQTGSVTQPEADLATAAKAPGGGSGAVPDEQAAETAGAAKQRDIRTASREEPPAAEPAPVRRTSVDRERTAPRHAGRKAHRSIRRSAQRSSFIERLFGPPRRGTNVITTGSFR